MSEAVETTVYDIVYVTDCKSLFEIVKSSKSVTEKQLQIEISGIKRVN